MKYKIKKTILFLLLANLTFFTSCENAISETNLSAKNKIIRKPTVSGTFYPSSKISLLQTVKKYLQDANPPTVEGDIKAIIVPHAGYRYSGLVAAYAYKTLIGKNFDTIILICNSHTASFTGISVFKEGYYETPLGLIEVDSELSKKLINSNPQISFFPKAHGDHTLEIQLPFLQTIFRNFKIVPILFGNDSANLANILTRALKENIKDKTLIIASTDMSHYPSYENANYADGKTIKAIETGDLKTFNKTIKEIENKKIPGEQTAMCGINGVRTLLELAPQIEASNITFLKYANSGDVPGGDKSRVVGYSAFTFSSKSTKNDSVLLNQKERDELLGIARSTVESYVQTGKIPPIKNNYVTLKKNLGAFVTLKKNGRLRGCIGRFQPNIPLEDVVSQMAIAAATQDHRFQKVSPKELKDIDYEISVLSPLKKVESADKIEIGKHGVKIQKGWRSGVFLPQVATEHNLDKETFLSMLCTNKAGLPADCWKDPSTELYVFTAEVFEEKH